MTLSASLSRVRKRRVVITGMGIICSLGSTLHEFKDSLQKGSSGVAPITNFDAGELPIRVASEVRNFAPEQFIQNRKSIKLMGRHIQLAVAAARSAFQSAELTAGSFVPERLGVSFGTGILNADLSDFRDVLEASLDSQGRLDYEAFGREAGQRVFPLWLLKYIPNMAASHISIMLNARGPSNTITTLCTSSGHAIGEGFWMIRNGQADLMVTGGTDAQVVPLGMTKFLKLGLLAPEASITAETSRPFDISAQGMVSGEAAACLILEESEHAKNRGAFIHGEIVGYGAATDTGESLMASPEGISLEFSARKALEDAELTPAEVDCASLTGNGIPLMDQAEASAMGRLFERNPALPVMAIKSMLGHTHAASGAVATVGALLALQEGFLPPILNLKNPILQFAPFSFAGSSRSLGAHTVLVNNLSFGGNSVCLVLRAFGA